MFSLESDFNFDQWFETFWQCYSSRFCSGDKGPKKKAKEAAAKKVKDAQIAKKCDLALEAQKRFYLIKKKRAEFVPNFPQVTKWFNQEYWTKEIPSLTEVPQKAQERPAEVQKPKLGKGDKMNGLQHLEYLKRLARGGL